MDWIVNRLTHCIFFIWDGDEVTSTVSTLLVKHSCLMVRGRNYCAECIDYHKENRPEDRAIEAVIMLSESFPDQLMKQLDAERVVLHTSNLSP